MRVEWRLSFSSVMEQLKSCPCSSKQPPLMFVPATLIKLYGWKQTNKQKLRSFIKIGKGLLEKGDRIGEKREGERVVWSKNDPNSGYSCMKLSEWEKGRGSYVQRVGRLWEGKEYYENTLYENLILQERVKGSGRFQSNADWVKWCEREVGYICVTHQHQNFPFIHSGW